MLSLKMLKPTKRERNRYIVYSIENVDGIENIQNKLIHKLKQNLGILNSARAGILPIEFDNKTKKGIIKVNHLMVDEVRANFVLISKLGDAEVLIKTIGVSGILKKAKEKYFSNSMTEKSKKIKVNKTKVE